MLYTVKSSKKFRSDYLSQFIDEHNLVKEKWGTKVSNNIKLMTSLITWSTTFIILVFIQFKDTVFQYSKLIPFTLDDDATFITIIKTNWFNNMESYLADRSNFTVFEWFIIATLITPIIVFAFIIECTQLNCTVFSQNACNLWIIGG